MKTVKSIHNGSFAKIVMYDFETMILDQKKCNISPSLCQLFDINDVIIRFTLACNRTMYQLVYNNNTIIIQHLCLCSDIPFKGTLYISFPHLPILRIQLCNIKYVK